MSTSKPKSKRDNLVWKQCLSCNLVIPAQDVTDHFCQYIPFDSNALERWLVSSERLNSSSKDTLFSFKSTPVRKHIENDWATPEKSKSPLSNLESPVSESKFTKPQGFCHRYKLFAICTSLPNKGNDLKNIPSSIQGELVCIHPSAMRVCGIGIGDPLLLRSATVPLQFGYAWPYSSINQTSVCVLDPIYKPGQLVQVQLYPRSVVNATHLVFETVSIEDKRLRDRMPQVVKIKLCNRTITEGSELSVDFFGRQLYIKIKTISGITPSRDVQELSNLDGSFLDSFDSSCSLQDNSEDICATDILPVSPASGFLTAVMTPRSQIIMNLEKEELPQFYRVTNYTTVSIYDNQQSKPSRDKPVLYHNIGGLEKEIAMIREIIQLVFKSPSTMLDSGISLPKGVIFFGPAGTGKTLLCHAIKQEENINLVMLNGPDILSRYSGEMESKLKEIFEDAVEQGPSLIFLDDLDLLCPKRERSTEQEKKFLNYLLRFIDSIQPDSDHVFFLGATNSLDAVDISLKRPGRLDKIIEIPVPTPTARIQILNKLLGKINHSLSSEDISNIAENAHSFTGGDLAVMVREAFQTCLQSKKEVLLTATDLMHCAKVIRPSAMKEVTLEVPKVHWSDIGGMEDLKLKLRQSVEWPLKHPEAFHRLGIKPPRGLLMYGPPGCSKTLIAKALATESGLNFLAIKGPELFNKWVGESERAVREVFRKARAASPSIVFFDEMDALAADRSGSQGASSVANRVLAQILNEMDGVESLQGVTVVAATNRPDMIDKALLRPGRLDRIVYVPLPDEQTRKEILCIKLREMPVAKDTDVDYLVTQTQGFSGAEVVALCQEAGLVALSESINTVCVHVKHFQQALKTIQPRTDNQLLDLYQHFQNQNSIASLN